METLAESPVPAEFSWFLEERFRQDDLALLHVIIKAPGGILRARVERVYLSRQEASGGFLMPGTEVNFVGSSGAWGLLPMLKPGDRALVFLSLSFIRPGHLYEASGFGHLFLEEIDNEPYAIYCCHKLWQCAWVPPFIRANTRFDPKRLSLNDGRSVSSAIRLSALETYLQALIEDIKQGHEPWARLRKHPPLTGKIRPFIYRRSRMDKIVLARHALIVARLQKLDGPFGLMGIEPPAPLFTDGGYWGMPRREDTGVMTNGWYAFRGNRVFTEKAVDDDNLNYKFYAHDKRIDYKRLIHDDFRQAIMAFEGYRAVWYFEGYDRAYLGGYAYSAEYSGPPTDDDGLPVADNEEYNQLCADKAVDVDGRNNIFTLHPAQYWDAELCQLALGYGPDEVIKRLQGQAPRAERLGDGVYLVLNDDPKMSFDDFLGMNELYKRLLGLR
jgi:hypothetical protein